MVTVGDQKFPWREGLTVARLLEMLDDDYDYAVVRINGELVSKPNFEKTWVAEDSIIIPIPMIAGG